MTDLTSKTIEELHTLFAATSHDANTSRIYQELARRLKEAQAQLEQSQDIRSDMGYLLLQLQQQLGVPTEPHQTYDERMLSAIVAHDAEVAAKTDAARDCAVTATAFEVAANIADAGFEGNHGNDCYTRQNLASTYRHMAAEYRAKGRKE